MVQKFVLKFKCWENVALFKARFTQNMPNGTTKLKMECAKSATKSFTKIRGKVLLQIFKLFLSIKTKNINFL